MAGILTEEPPQGHQDIFDLIGDFLGNGGRLTRNQIWESCGEILRNLNNHNLIRKENKHTLSAERLPNSIVLKELDFFQDKETAIGGYEDMFRGVKKAVNTNEDIDHTRDPKKMKKQNLEEQKAAQAYERHI